MISLFVSPATIRAEMNARMRFAIGALDWSSVVLQVGHITSPSSSPSVGWRSLASAGAASASASARDEQRSHVWSARRMPASQLGRADLARDALADEAAAAVDEERLREAGDAVLREHVPGPVVDVRIGELVLAR